MDKVTSADVDAAAAFLRRDDTGFAAKVTIVPQFLAEAFAEHRIAHSPAAIEGHVVDGQVPPFISVFGFEERNEQRACINGCLYLRADFTGQQLRVENETLQAQLAARDAEIGRLRESLRHSEIWLTAALECKHWHWDGDQREAAIEARDNAIAAFGHGEG